MPTAVPVYRRGPTAVPGTGDRPRGARHRGDYTGTVASWFSRRRPLVEIPRLRPRNRSVTQARVNLSDLAPELLPYLGQAAYLQLDAFESLSRAAGQAPSLSAKESISVAAARTIAKHQGLVAEIRRHNEDPTAVMEPFSAAIDAFQRVTRGADWQENLLGVYLTSGLLDDFFLQLAEGLPGDVGPRIAQLLGSDAGQPGIVAVLRDAIAHDPRLASRLALWGRRLIGDTLLVARSALNASGNVGSTGSVSAGSGSVSSESVEQRIEPVFTELIAAHTRRMDALGLTA